MKEIIPSLIKLADHLDKKGFSKEASFTDEIIKKIAMEEEVDEKDKPEEKEMMSPYMKDDESKEEEGSEEACCMKADANLKTVQLRQRARQRRLMLKNS